MRSGAPGEIIPRCCNFFATSIYWPAQIPGRAGGQRRGGAEVRFVGFQLQKSQLNRAVNAEDWGRPVADSGYR
eukprot:8713088-Pyramimonas_sp.AAC.1